MNDTNANKWVLFKKDVHALEIGEERIVLVDDRAIKMQLAEVSDLDRIHRGMICMD